MKTKTVLKWRNVYKKLKVGLYVQTLTSIAQYVMFSLVLNILFMFHFMLAFQRIINHDHYNFRKEKQWLSLIGTTI